MMLKTNDATARMIEAFKKGDGQESLANVALMWADWYTMKSQCISDDVDAGEYVANGLLILTRFIQHCNEG